jgi:hypothetical protein
MQIKRIQNSMGNFYDYSLIDGDKELRIFFARNYDLFFILDNHTLLSNENIEMDFNITKEDYDLYLIFDKAYNRFVTSKNNNLNYSFLHDFYQLVDEDNNINWISDEGPVDIEDKLVISKEEDSFRLRFIRSDKNYDYNNSGICIRVRNSGSRYNPFNCIFMELYDNLQSIDPLYRQINLYEYLNRDIKVLKMNSKNK